MRTDHHQRRAWEPEPPKAAPGAVWQGKARAFVDHCTGQLKRNSEAVAWLRTERGLNPEMISRAGLGWNDRDLYQARTAWGLPPETNQKSGKPKKVWLPSGLVITMTDEACQVVRLRIRRNNPESGSRYVVVSGSSMGAMVQWQDQRAVAVVEAELDGLLVAQEAGELIGVVALGSAAMKPDELLHRRLMAAGKVLCCLDSDQAGGKAAWGGHWRKYPGFEMAYHQGQGCHRTMAGRDTCPDVDSSGVVMISAIVRVYSDCGPWGDWEPAIKAEMERAGIPNSKRDRLTVVCCPESMKPRGKRLRECKKVK